MPAGTPEAVVTDTIALNPLPLVIFFGLAEAAVVEAAGTGLLACVTVTVAVSVALSAPASVTLTVTVLAPGVA